MLYVCYSCRRFKMLQNNEANWFLWKLQCETIKQIHMPRKAGKCSRMLQYVPYLSKGKALSLFYGAILHRRRPGSSFDLSSFDSVGQFSGWGVAFSGRFWMMDALLFIMHSFLYLVILDLNAMLFVAKKYLKAFRLLLGVMWNRLINASAHHILKTAHPSGLSANRGFFGCRYIF